MEVLPVSLPGLFFLCVPSETGPTTWCPGHTHLSDGPVYYSYSQYIAQCIVTTKCCVGKTCKVPDSVEHWVPKVRPTHGPNVAINITCHKIRTHRLFNMPGMNFTDYSLASVTSLISFCLLPFWNLHLNLPSYPWYLAFGLLLSHCVDRFP